MKRSLSAVLVLALGVLMAPAPAAAEPSLPWPSTPICGEGAIAGGPRTTDSPPRTPLVFSIRPCAGTDPALLGQAHWAIALYFDGSALVSGAPARFPADGSTVAEATRGFSDRGLLVYGRGTVRAACLLTDQDVKVACVRVDAVGEAGTIEIAPIPVTDGRVYRRAAIVPPDRGNTNPECAACV